MGSAECTITPALDLTEKYFNEIAYPSFAKAFPDLVDQAAFGLVGNGSECLCFDDIYSCDHDWGVDFFCFMPDDAYDVNLERIDLWKKQLFAENPPEFKREQSEYGGYVKTMRVGDFYQSLLGVRKAPDDLYGWICIPQDNLTLATNGRVFLDNEGTFTKIRNDFLAFYPEDLYRKRVAYRLSRMAQSGQYNYPRVAARVDWTTLSYVAHEFVGHLTAMVYLLNKTYQPYYKWAYTGMKRLPLLGTEAAQLVANVSLNPAQDLVHAGECASEIEEICRLVANAVRDAGLSSTSDGWLTAQGEDVRAGINDEWLRSTPIYFNI